MVNKEKTIQTHSLSNRRMTIGLLEKCIKAAKSNGATHFHVEFEYIDYSTVDIRFYKNLSDEEIIKKEIKQKEKELKELKSKLT